MRAKNHIFIAAILCLFAVGCQTVAAQGVQGEMRRFYNIDQGFAANQYVPKFLQGIMVGSTAYTNAQLNAALAGGSGPGIVTVSDTITAGATQTQAGATLLTSTFNNVTVVATAGDGVRLPTAAAGTRVTIRNSDSTDTLKAYPFSGDSINALAVNLSVDIPALSETTFTAKDATVWYSEPTALYLSSPTTLTGGLQIKAAANAGNTTTLITNASQAAARTYTVPDAGANANFVMTEGAQTVNGVKTFGSPSIPSNATGITAGATQTQVGATALTAEVNTVTTVGTAEDGVALPAAVAGQRITVVNEGGTTLKVWPASGDAIDAYSANTGFLMQNLTVETFYAKDSTTWHSTAYLKSAAIVQAGASGQTGTLRVFPSTASSGKLDIGTANNSGNTTTSISVAAQAAARTYALPDWSTSASTDAETSLAGIKVVANTTNRPGALGCLLFATGDSKLYVCTTASATAATWTVVGGQS